MFNINIKIAAYIQNINFSCMRQTVFNHRHFNIIATYILRSVITVKFKPCLI